MATFKSQHLQAVLDSHKMRKIQALMDKFIVKREEVKNALNQKYSDKLLCNPINSGSFAKHTAINKKFDIDICPIFSRTSFNTLEEMADELFRYFENEYKDNHLQLPIKKQRVSIGLEFNIDGDIIKMDVVPGREINDEEYATTYDLKLYVRAKDDNPATETKTNIKKHVDLINGRTDVRSIIRLLKCWKYYNDKEIKSFILELLTLRAYEENKNNLPTDLWEQLEMTLKFIADRIETIQLVDPANSNNIVSNTMLSDLKKTISLDIKNMLDHIYNDETFIMVYFKVNSDFPGNDNNKYQKKASGPSILETQSFG